jgi:MYXO-CTERM domain-containing protein
MKRLLSATLTAGASLALAASSAGAIVWFPSEDIAIPTTLAGVVVNLQTGADTVGDDAPGADVNFFFGGFGIGNDADSTATMPTFQPVRISAGTLAAVDNLTVGTPVSGASTFAVGYGGSASHIPSEFTAGTPGYLGFSLDTGSGLVFGWMRVTLEANTTAGVIHEWAYEASGGSILVGAVPEAGVPFLALLGLGGLALRRRR